MDRDASFHDAKRLYLESYGDPMVTNTYLKIALALLALVCVALALIDLRTIRTFENFRPLVIRIDDLGRAEAINYHNFEYKPQDAEAKYFLSQFTKLYYRRNRYTIQDDFAKSLYFLDGKIANGIFGGWDLAGIFRWNSGLPTGTTRPFAFQRWATNWQISSGMVRVRPVETTSGDVNGVPNIFADPTAVFQSYRDPKPGEAGDRNVLRYPGYFSIDTGLHKTFKMPWEGQTLTFRWEVFNLTNSVRFDPHSVNVNMDNQGSFGIAGSTLTDKRVMQVALRLEF